MGVFEKSKKKKKPFTNYIYLRQNVWMKNTKEKNQKKKKNII